MSSAAENMARMNDAARRLRPHAEKMLAQRLAPPPAPPPPRDPNAERVMRQQRTLGGRESCCG